MNTHLQHAGGAVVRKGAAALAVLLIVAGGAPVIAFANGSFEPGPLQRAVSNCGNATIDETESCDDGAGNSDQPGAWCGADCSITPCGSPVTRDPEQPRSTDALFALRAAVASASCDEKVCDVNDANGITVADALLILRAAVGQSVTLSCPVPVLDITCVNKTFPSVADVFEALEGAFPVLLDDGAGTVDDLYVTGAIQMQVKPNFNGKHWVFLSVDGSTKGIAAYYDDGRVGESWEELEHEVNVFFVAEQGTTKILQCDKTTGQLTYVIQTASGPPGFARFKTEAP